MNDFLKHLLAYEAKTSEEIQEEVAIVLESFSTKYLMNITGLTKHSIHGWRKSAPTKPSYKAYLQLLDLKKNIEH